MPDSRAVLKSFFETGDIPTQAEFASLIDSLLSLVNNSNLKNDILIKSETDGKIQIKINDTGLEFTTDGGAFSESDFIFTPDFIRLATKGKKVGIFITSGQFENIVMRGNPSSVDPSFYAIGDEASVLIPRGLAITEKTLKEFALIPSFDNDFAASAGGLTKGDFYQTTGGGSAPLNVAGLLVLKQ